MKSSRFFAIVLRIKIKAFSHDLFLSGDVTADVDL